MTDLRDLLRQHATTPRQQLDFEALLARAHRRRLRGRLAAWLAGLAALGAIAVPAEQAFQPAGTHTSVHTVRPQPGPAPNTPNQKKTSLPHTLTPSGGVALPTPGSPAVGGPLTANSPAGASHTDPNASGAASNSDVPVAPVPLRPGKYLYSYHVTAAGIPTQHVSGQSPLIVSAPSRNQQGQLQHEIFTFDEGGGYVVTDQWDMLYNAAGLHQQHFVSDETYHGAPYDHEDCTDPPDALILPTGVRPGDHWQFSQTCNDRLNGTSTNTVAMTDSGKTPIPVAGQYRQAVTIDQSWGPNDTESPSLDPTTGLTLDDEVSTGTTGGGFSFSERLQSITPS